MDQYKAHAAKRLGIPYEDVSPEEREFSKNVLFAEMYKTETSFVGSMRVVTGKIIKIESESIAHIEFEGKISCIGLEQYISGWPVMPPREGMNVRVYFRGGTNEILRIRREEKSE